MTGIPPEVNLQVADAIKGAFNEEKLWREIRTRTGQNLESEIPQHLNLTDQIFELLDWLGKRGRTVEILDHLNAAVPGNTRLQAATDAYKTAAHDARENAVEQPSAPQPFAQRQPVIAGSSKPVTTNTGSGRTGFQMKPWMWMLAGAVALLVVVGLFIPEDDPFSYGDDADLDAQWDRCTAQDLSACDALFENSADGSDYQLFGATCGGQLFDGQPLNIATSCVEYGANLDFLAGACGAGDTTACDELYRQSPDASLYLELASACGGLEIDGAIVSAPGQCTAEFGSSGG